MNIYNRTKTTIIALKHYNEIVKRRRKKTKSRNKDIKV